MQVDTAATRSLPSMIAGEPPLFVVRFFLKGEKYTSEVEIDTTHGAVSFDGAKHQIECRPDSKPYSFVLTFHVPVVLAEEPIQWTEPGSKPPWIKVPERSEDGRSVEMTVIDASDREERASFLLVPAKIQGDGPQPQPIDPTIVSNPPN